MLIIGLLKEINILDGMSENIIESQLSYRYARNKISEGSDRLNLYFPSTCSITWYVVGMNSQSIRGK